MCTYMSHAVACSGPVTNVTASAWAWHQLQKPSMQSRKWLAKQPQQYQAQCRLYGRQYPKPGSNTPANTGINLSSLMFSKCSEILGERSASAQKHSQSRKHTWLDDCLCLSSDLLRVNVVIYCMFHLLVEQLLSARSQTADRLSVLVRYLWLTACIAFLRGQHVTEQLVDSKTPYAVGVSSCLMRYLCQNPRSWGACAVWANVLYLPQEQNVYF